MSNGILLGRVGDTATLTAGLKALVDRRVPHGVAVRRFILACNWRKRTRSRLVLLKTAIHVLVCSPPGGGKTTGPVNTTLLTDTASAVVVDVDGTIFEATAAARHRMGHRVVRIAPFASALSDTYNPIAGHDPDDDRTPDAIEATADALVKRAADEREPIWSNLSISEISLGIGFVVAFAGVKERHLQSVRDVLCDGDKRARMIDVCKKSDRWNGTLARWANGAAQVQGKTLQSVQAHVGTMLRFLDAPAVHRNTLVNSFTPSQLLTGKMTVYLVIPPDQLAAKSNLLRLWIGSLLQECVKSGPQERKIVRFIIDEAAALGHMVEIEQALNQYRKYGVRLMLIYQSLGQLKACWPNGQDQTVLAGCSKVVMGVNDYQTADYFSSLLGDFTNVSESGGRSLGGSSQHSSGGQQSASRSESWNENHNWSTHARRLLKPEEILNLDIRTALVVTPGVRPFTVRTCRSFEGDWKPDRGMGAFKIVADTLALFLMAAFAAFLAAALYR